MLHWIFYSFKKIKDSINLIGIVINHCSGLRYVNGFIAFVAYIEIIASFKLDNDTERRLIFKPEYLRFS